MIQIPDASVETAANYIALGIDKGSTPRAIAENALTAALPHLPLGYEVKQLEWSSPYLDGDQWNALSCFGMYRIWEINGVGYWSFDSLSGTSCSGGLLKAKAAAQADFERRVRECIVATVTNDGSNPDFYAVYSKSGMHIGLWPDKANADEALLEYEGGIITPLFTKPVDLASVRRQAFEEAATLIDEGFDKQVGKAWRNDGRPSKNDKCPHDKFMYEDCVHCASDAIRALSAEPAQHPDDTAVDNFARIMKEKLAKKRSEGRSGWQDMSAAELSEILHRCVAKGDPVDVANICMMLSENGQQITPAEPVQGEQWQPTHRHVKRGTEYQLIGTGKMQAEKWVDGSTIKPTHNPDGKLQITSNQVDMQEVAIYRGEDGQLWARPIAEFNDGRFEPLSAAPTSEASNDKG